MNKWDLRNHFEALVGSNTISMSLGFGPIACTSAFVSTIITHKLQAFAALTLIFRLSNYELIKMIGKPTINFKNNLFQALSPEPASSRGYCILYIT